MELDELKKVWKAEEPREKFDYGPSELIAMINNRMIALESRIRSRDRLEIIACIIIIAVFFVLLVTAESTWKRVGSAILVTAGILIWIRLKKTQKASFAEQPSPDQPISEFLKKERKAIRKQKSLLKNIGWWYILPIAVGLLTFTAGFDASIWFKAGYAGVIILVAAVVWILNQRAAREKFDPLLEDIEQALTSLEQHVE